jgi:pyruvate/2-oxoglutarate dehydrogenase complex dihydrolipoamide acyltransferase (E2) component
MVDVVLPETNWEGVDAGTEALLDRWLVREGERVSAGQAVARVVLVKTSLEVPAPASGVLERIVVAEGATFARGAPLAHLRGD